MTGTFSVKNFEKRQHYKDRDPPWIKFYNTILDDYEIGQLPDASKAHLFAIWLLASRYSNKIPYDTEWVSRRINATSSVDLSLLEKYGFIVLDQECSDLLATSYQDARPETYREETELSTFVPKGTQAAGAALNGNSTKTPIDFIWSAGLQILTSKSVPENQARSLLGKWRKAISDDAKLAGILTDAAKANPIDIVPYITEMIKPPDPRRNIGKAAL